MLCVVTLPLTWGGGQVCGILRQCQNVATLSTTQSNHLQGAQRFIFSFISFQNSHTFVTSSNYQQLWFTLIMVHIDPHHAQNRDIKNLWGLSHFTCECNGETFTSVNCLSRKLLIFYITSRWPHLYQDWRAWYQLHGNPQQHNLHSQPHTEQQGHVIQASASSDVVLLHTER